MVTDAFIRAFLPIIERLLDVLPEGGEFPLPSLEPITTRLLEIDTIIPIAAPIAAVAMTLPLILVFVTIRVVVFIRHFVLP